MYIYYGAAGRDRGPAILFIRLSSFCVYSRVRRGQASWRNHQGESIIHHADFQQLSWWSGSFNSFFFVVSLYQSGLLAILGGVIQHKSHFNCIYTREWGSIKYCCWRHLFESEDEGGGGWTTRDGGQSGRIWSDIHSWTVASLMCTWERGAALIYIKVRRGIPARNAARARAGSSSTLQILLLNLCLTTKNNAFPLEPTTSHTHKKGGTRKFLFFFSI